MYKKTFNEQTAKFIKGINMIKILTAFCFGWLWLLSIVLSAVLAIIAGIIALPSIAFENIASKIEKLYYANIK